MSLLMFKDRTRVSCKWTYSDPVTGTTFGLPGSPAIFTYFSRFEDLVRAVGKHIRDNQKETPSNLAWVVEDQICRSLHASLVKQRPVKVKASADKMPVNSPGASRNSVFQRVASATQTIKAFWSGNEGFVQHHIVGRRARICKECPRLKDTGIGNCPSCLSTVRLLSAGRTHEFDGPLDGKACGICDCFATAKIHYPISAIAKGTRAELMPLFDATPGCWVREGIRSLPLDQQPDYQPPKPPEPDEKSEA